MDKTEAALLLYKATHNIGIPMEDFLNATRWFLWYFKSRPTDETLIRMRNWSEIMVSALSSPYKHIDTQV